MSEVTPAIARSNRRRNRRRALGLGIVLTYLIVAVFGGCADMLLLHATNNPIPVPGGTRIEIPVPGRPPVETYILGANIPAGGEPVAYLLVFDGNGGRAEGAVQWGSSVTGGRAVEVWSMNYPGFGGSPGSATLTGIGPAALATFDLMQKKAAGKPVVVWGASLGTTAALQIAAHRQVSAVILTNPPPLRQLIMEHYGWWNLWLAAIPVTLGIPADLDNVTNGAMSKAPALIATANEDGVVPPPYHKMVIDAYAGPEYVVHLPGAGHNTPAATAAPAAWDKGIEWLWQQVGK